LRAPRPPVGLRNRRLSFSQRREGAPPRGTAEQEIELYPRQVSARHSADLQSIGGAEIFIKVQGDRERTSGFPHTAPSGPAPCACPSGALRDLLHRRTEFEIALATINQSAFEPLSVA
jgi:hypothetical protein